MNILIDLFDHSGNAAEPYRNNGWHVIQVDIKHGIDILTWDYEKAIKQAYQEVIYSVVKEKGFCKGSEIEFGVLAAIPCTDFALSGAAHFAKKDTNGETDKSNLLVDKVHEILNFIIDKYELTFYRIENPMSRIHKLNTWLGAVKFKFNPCDFSGYLDVLDDERARLYSLRDTDISKLSKQDIKAIMDANLYNKMTWFWGDFNDPVKKRFEPVYKEFPGHRLYGGKSEKTKELRSVDPKGLCLAFYEANH